MSEAADQNGESDPHDGAASSPSTPPDQSATAVAGPGTVIAFHYDLYDGDAQRIESSAGGEPIVFLYGQPQVLAALQEAFCGKQAGDDFSITIPHASAYGRHYPDRIQRIPRKRIDVGRRQSFRVGQIVHLESPQGQVPGTIVKVGKFNLDVDANHPLAGRDLTFDVKVFSVRPATSDEVAHGHAHGPGGHQHE